MCRPVDGSRESGRTHRSAPTRSGKMFRNPRESVRRRTLPAGRDGARPLHGNRKFQQPPGPAAHSGASAARSRGVGRNRGRDHPQSVQQRRTIPQSPCGRQLPLHKGAFGDGDTDCRVASLLAMTVLILCHSEEAQRADVGIRPFLRWTGVRAAVPRAWPPPTKFRTEIWGVGQVVGPYGRSTGVPATGRCRHRPLRNEAGTAATSRAAL